MILILFGVGVVAQVVTGGFPTTTGATGDYNSIAWGWGWASRWRSTWRAGSAAHLNPAVTVALAAFKGFQRAQGRALHRSTAGGRIRRGAPGALGLFRRHQPRRPRPHQGPQGIFSTSPDIGVSIPTAFLDQIIGTAILVMVIFALTSAVNNPPLGNTAPLFIGLLVVGIGSGGAPTPATPSTRPATSRPHRVLADRLPRRHVFDQRAGLYFWLPIVAPLVGGLIGGALFVFGIERFLPAAITEPAEIGVVEPTPLR